MGALNHAFIGKSTGCKIIFLAAALDFTINVRFNVKNFTRKEGQNVTR